MRWELGKNEGNPLDPHGVGAFLRRLERQIAGPGERLTGFTFLQDANEMLRYSRTIEDELLRRVDPSTLYVGFQNAEKAEAEGERYAQLQAAGISTVAFGEGTPSDRGLSSFSSWSALETNHDRLENQWFLVEKAVAFVGWEVSSAENWGRGGAATAGKEFVGFVSDDARVVAAIIAHLEAVRTGGGDEPDPGVDLLSLIERVRPKKTLALVDDGKRSCLARSAEQVLAGCAAVGSRVFLYDLSAASYLVDPYPSYDKEWRKPLEPKTLRSLGRSYLAELVEHAQQTGVEAWGILPDDVGFAQLAKWCTETEVDLVVLPVEFNRPPLVARLQGLTLEALRSNADVSIVVEDPEAGSWLIVAREAARALVS